ncbi:hypothetical protein [Streptomyces scabiei]|uniref:hypothetical protein n=1 Tax=Streptomyces scabiei TaxID=1930 RepID=UPI0039F52AEA
MSRARRAGGAETAGESEELARLRRENAQLQKATRSWPWSVMCSNAAWSCG